MDFASIIRGAVQVAIIRSSYPRHLEDALKKVKELNPDAKTTVLVMPRMVPALKGHTMIDEIISLPTDQETYSPNIEPQFIDSVRKRQLPLFIILYNRANQCGYQNVEKLALSFQPREIWGMTSDGEFFHLSDSYRFIRGLKRMLIRLFYAPVVLPMVCLLRFSSFYLRRAAR